jgi:hypothetical protein
MHIARSKNGAVIRLPDERWLHITEEQSELAGGLKDILETISDPLRVYAGSQGEMLAARKIVSGKFLVVVYKETGANDGFVITALLTRRLRQLERRRLLWPS